MNTALASASFRSLIWTESCKISAVTAVAVAVTRAVAVAVAVFLAVSFPLNPVISTL